jgi:hypothetical protein
MDGWLRLGEDSHVPHQLDLDGLVDLDFPHSGPQSGTRAARWMEGWLCLGEDSHVPHQLDLVGLIDLVVALSQGITLVLCPTTAALSRNPRAARMDEWMDGWMATSL